MARLVSAAETLAELVDRIPDEVPSILKMNMSDPGRFADLAATNMNFRIADKDEIIQRLDIAERIRFVLSRLEREVAKARVMEDIKRQTEVKIEQHQREFYLRQQLRAIQAELGEADPGEKDAIDIFKKIEDAKLPEKVAAEARRETERMRMLSPASSEYQVIRTYLDWLLSLPWHARSGAESIELAKVQEALDGRHYGLKEAKERIIEYLAVRKLRGGDPLGPILCFVGSPGTGKTSLGEAIAKAIGREFYRISVGGVRDEAEIRGHRRTYVGAMPGLVIQAMRRVALRDPVLMIDEIDKMTSGGMSGDPTAAMLEVLDPSQNHSFVDHYINVPFDLSGVLFICTANNLFDIPAPLRDRLEVIQIAGYTIEEKVEIAWRYLLPKLFEEHGITDKDLQFTDEMLSLISSGYSREAGLRGFSRNIAAIMRKRARKKADGEEGAWIADLAMVEEVLGSPRYAKDEAETEPEIGTATGMAWTSSGGDLMVIEALKMPGTGKLTVTGQLGDVMRESVYAALSYVRSRSAQLAHPRRDVQGLRHPHPSAGGGHSKGWPERGHHGDARHRERALGARGAPRRGDDGRGHAARQGARDRRHEGEDHGGASRGTARGDRAEEQREGPARDPRRGARRDDVHLRGDDGRGLPARAAARGAAQARGYRAEAGRGREAGHTAGAQRPDRDDGLSAAPLGPTRGKS